MDLRQLSYFVAVAEEAHFTRAAARVSVAQPAVSAQIRRLERELGEPLFRRDPRSVALTAAGEALLPHARAALAAAEAGREAIAALRGLMGGRLAIGVSPPAVARFVALVGAFHRAHPAVEIALSEGQNETLVAAVARGELDAALVGLGGRPLPPGVRTRTLAAEPLALAVGRGHRLARRATVAIAELRDEPMISLARGSGLRATLEAACAEAGFVPRIAAETGELGSLVRLVAEGLGIGVAPASALAGADVTALRIVRPRLERRTALVWNPAGASPAGRALVELSEDHLGGERPGAAQATAAAAARKTPPSRSMPSSISAGPTPL